MLLLGCLLALSAAPAAAEKPAVERFRDSLRRGQFPAALKIARNAPGGKEHDAMLAMLALSRVQAGAGEAAYQTAGEIYDGETQKQTAAYIRYRLEGKRGGAMSADFDSLIELLTTTIAPNSWDEVGGPGSVKEFRGGVYVDARGTLRPLVRIAPDSTLEQLRLAVAEEPAAKQSVRRKSRLRMISLPRLEREIERLRAAGKPPTEAMRMLAGLRRIRYVFVYPESGDLVLAGPAGDWKTDAQGRIVAADTGLPVVRLDDLVVVFRHMLAHPNANIGCSITPTRNALARTQAFLNESSKHPLRPGQREAWLDRLRETLGMQEIEIFGLDPRTRAARVMVEADYHMKLVGMGLEPGVLGVESYLESIHVPPGQAPPPLGVLRWWFTLNYQAVLATPDYAGFEIRGQGARVLSENELLAAQGRRVHTGKSDALNQKFAHSFTEHFAALCQKYPVYADLRNVFDLALVGALLQSEDLAARVNWDMDLLRDEELHQVRLGTAPKQVATVINHRIINKIHIVAGVSGGVSAAPHKLVTRAALKTDPRGAVAADRQYAAPRDLPQGRWWWD